MVVSDLFKSALVRMKTQMGILLDRAQISLLATLPRVTFALAVADFTIYIFCLYFAP